MSYRDDHEPVPATFADLAQTDLAKELRKFITAHETIAAMAEATELRRPAVAALPPATVMVRMFGKGVKADRVKQYIGHLVKQVMTKGPYELAAQARPRLLILYHHGIALRPDVNPAASSPAELLGEVSARYSGHVVVGHDLDVY